MPNGLPLFAERAGFVRDILIAIGIVLLTLAFAGAGYLYFLWTLAQRFR
jgi:hypothetical protein